ncbi:MAG: carbohydrate binding domain-containing protein, partial [Oscillospiraceae bacterium]|nr:carbohydrate binding domain-containing protein [Oscillospiraceae bacterium]
IKDAGYITEERCNSLIEAQSDKITLSVEENLKIGTRNILLNSECFAGFKPTGYKVSRATMVPSISDTYVPSGKYSVVGFDSVSDGESTTRGVSFVGTDILGQSTIDKIKPNTTYTLSFWLRTRSGAQVDELTKYAVIYAGDNANVTLDTRRSITPTPTESWQKYVLTFKITGTISKFYIRMFFENCKDGTQKPSEANVQYWIDISSFKLEEGNIATDWTPSAEDIDQSVKAQIDLCVKTDENGKLVSEILIESNKLRINTDNFKLDGNGNMTCVNADITGKITATSGIIGGWSVDQNALCCVYGGNRAFIQAPSNDKDYYIAVGDSYSDNSYSIKFALLANGEVLTPEISTMNSSLTISTATSIKNRRDNFEIGGATYTIKGDTNYRDFIRSKGGFVVEAGNGSNSITLLGDPINLMGSEIYVNGEISLGSVIFRYAIDSTKSDTAYKYLVVFEKDGSLGFASP